MIRAAAPHLKVAGRTASPAHWLCTSAQLMTGAILELDFGMHLNTV